MGRRATKRLVCHGPRGPVPIRSQAVEGDRNLHYYPLFRYDRSMATKTFPRKMTFAGQALILIGLILGAYSLYTVLNRTHTSGEVVEAGIGEYPSRITFMDSEQMRLSFHEDPTSPFVPALRKGQHVDVMYKHGSAETSARINSFSRVWLWPAVASVAGILCLAFRGKTPR